MSALARLQSTVFLVGLLWADTQYVLFMHGLLLLLGLFSFPPSIFFN